MITPLSVGRSGFHEESGFAGQCRDASYLQGHADLTLRLNSQTGHLSYPSAGQYVDAAFDGAGLQEEQGSRFPRSKAETRSSCEYRDRLLHLNRKVHPRVNAALEVMSAF